MRGEQPTMYIVVNTPLGDRAYGNKELIAVFDTAPILADGSHLADGSWTAGGYSAGVLEKSGRVLDFGTFERTISPRTDDLLAAYSGKQRQHISLQLDNADAYFAQLIGKEPFLGRGIKAFVGFEDEPQANHLNIFAGTISEISMLSVMTVEADER